jgi:putative ABC transport system permease protein
MPLGWLQLKHKPLRLIVALSGISFAVLLIMMQLGFRSALFESAVRFHERFAYDIALFSPDSVFIVRPEPFSIRRLYQAMGHEAVEGITPVYIFPSVWKNPWNTQRRSINTIGFHPDSPLLDIEGFDQSREFLRRQDVVLFDSRSRPEFGPVREALLAGEPVVTEINDPELTAL